jgi:uncharacterized protein YegP (UPF0339 family)
VIGQSQIYEVTRAVKNGIASVGRNCESSFKDLTE